MKLKKKSLTCFFLLLLLGMNACSASKIDEKALEQYTSMLENLKDVASFDYDASMMIDATYDQTPIRMKLSGSGSYLFQDEFPEFQTKVNIAVNGIKLSDHFELYSKDCALYYNFMGEKVKISLMDEILDLSPYTDAMQETDIQDTLKEISMQTDQEDRMIHVVFDPDFMQKQVELQNKAVEEMELLVREASADFTLDPEDHFKKIDYLILLELNQEKATIKFTFETSNRNGIDDIEFPNLNEFMEVPLSESILEGTPKNNQGEKKKQENPYEDLGGEHL